MLLLFGAIVILIVIPLGLVSFGIWLLYASYDSNLNPILAIKYRQNSRLFIINGALMLGINAIPIGLTTILLRVLSILITVLQFHNWYNQHKLLQKLDP